MWEEKTLVLSSLTEVATMNRVKWIINMIPEHYLHNYSLLGLIQPQSWSLKNTIIVETGHFTEAASTRPVSNIKQTFAKILPTKQACQLDDQFQQESIDRVLIYMRSSEDKHTNTPSSSMSMMSVFIDVSHAASLSLHSMLGLLSF